MSLLDRFGQYDATATIYIGPAEEVADSGGGGAQIEGDGAPVDAPTVGTDETIFYWDRTNKALYVWDSVDVAWYPVVA